MALGALAPHNLCVRPISKSRYFGLFPCKRVADPETGNVTLQPIGWKFQLLLYFVMYLIIGQSGSNISMVTTLSNATATEEFYKCLQTFNSSFGGSFIDMFGQFSIIILYFMLSFLVQWGNFKAKEGLCTLSRMGNYKHICYKTKWKILRPLLLVVIGQLILAISNSIAMAFVNAECGFIDFNLSIAISFPSTISTFLLGYPCIIFFAITMESLNLLIEKSSNLRRPIYDCVCLRKKLENHIEFFKCLSTTRKLLSSNNFYLMTILSIQILIFIFTTAYYTVHNFDNANIFLALNMTTNFGYCFTFVLQVYYLNIWSQNCTDEIHELSNHLRNLIIPDDDIIEKMEFEEQRAAPIAFVKKRIEEQLQEFRGFDAKGYFILGKSFLKNLVAFCATYFVILLQFKMTDSNPSQLKTNSTVNTF